MPGFADNLARPQIRESSIRTAGFIEQPVDQPDRWPPGRIKTRKELTSTCVVLTLSFLFHAKGLPTMQGYFDRTFLTDKDRNLLAHATRIVESLPEESNGHPLRCHEVARVVGRLLNLCVIDGKFGKVDHSWLVYYAEPSSDRKEGELRTKEQELRILDPYCVGRLPLVQLIDGNLSVWSALPYTQIYVPGYPRSDINEKRVQRLIDEIA